jgi:nickel-dependent lactate racemase
MVEVWLPYGETEVHVSVEAKNISDEVRSRDEQPKFNANELVSNALSNPINVSTFERLLDQKRSIALSIDGTISPFISTTVLSELIRRLTKHSIPRNNVTIVIANGTRTESNPKLLSALHGNKEFEQVKIVENNGDNLSFKKLGLTKNHTPIEISTLFTDSTVKIAIGEVSLDAYTGFTGAYTSIFPGLASQKTIEANRKHYFKGATPGKIHQNLMKEDAFEIVNKVGIDYSINLVTNNVGHLLSVYTGEMEQSWVMALDNYGGSFESSIRKNADIAVVSAGGIKHDFDLYNASWALISANKSVKRNGTIILIAECREGLGPFGFARLTHINILSELERRYQLGSEMIHLIKSIGKSKRLILVSALPGYFIEPLGFEAADTAIEGYELAQNSRGRKTVFIPYGCSTIIK